LFMEDRAPELSQRMHNEVSPSTTLVTKD